MYKVFDVAEIDGNTYSRIMGPVFKKEIAIEEAEFITKARDSFIGADKLAGKVMVWRLVEALLKTNSALARTKYEPGSDVDKLIEANDNLLDSLEVE